MARFADAIIADANLTLRTTHIKHICRHAQQAGPMPVRQRRRHFFSLFYNADNASHNTASGQCCMKASLNIYDAGKNKFIERISHTAYAPQKRHSFNGKKNRKENIPF